MPSPCHHRRPTWSSLPLIPALLLGACGGDATRPEPPKPGSVMVTPASAALLAIGDTARFSAQARDTDGNVLDTATFTWAVTGAPIATVDAQGLVTATATGTASVEATLNGSTLKGSSAVSVEQQVSAVQVSGMPDSLLVGQQATLAAAASDRNGNPIPNAAFSWSSTDEQVATVTAAGVVTAVGDGTAGIRATAAGANAEAQLRVRRRNVVVAKDTALSGNVQLRSFSVAQGVTVTLNGPLTLNVQERASIAGTVRGDCRSFAVNASGAISVTGTIDNGCSDSTASTWGDVRLVGTDTVRVNGTIITSGAVYITNDSSLTESAFPPLDTAGTGNEAGRKPASVTSASGAQNGDICELNGRIDAPPRMKTSVSKGAGVPGSDLIVRCDGDIYLGDVVIRGQWGQAGSTDRQESATFAKAEGSPGGPGGAVRIEATGQVVVTGNAVVEAGNGGAGGGAAALGKSPGGTPDLAAGAEAIGGRGGGAGLVRVLGLAGFGGFTFTIDAGRGGNGGWAYAKGADGVDAAAGQAAQAGGYALARGGLGGTGYYASFGGKAEARGGNGGNGSAEFPDGAVGGNGRAYGGKGGRFRPHGQFPIKMAGVGGDAALGRGLGGNGFGSCDPAVARGGSGGRGGAIYGYGGEAGDGPQPGQVGDLQLWQVANGGNGGAGLSPGAAGQPGVDGTTGAKTSVEEPSLKPGTPGTTCPPPAPRVGIEVGTSVISNTHVIGGSSCPQLFGTSTLTNTGDVTVTWQASPSSSGISVSPSSGSLQPGQSTTLTVYFTCNVAQSFTATVNIQAQGANDAGSASGTVTVNATVQ